MCTQGRAATLLWRLLDENPSSHHVIAHAGSAEELILLLRSGSAAAKAYSLWSLSLSIDASNQAVVIAEGGVAALVEATGGQHAIESRRQAAAALSRLAHGDPRRAHRPHPQAAPTSRTHRPRSGRDQAEIRPRSGRDQAEITCSQHH